VEGLFALADQLEARRTKARGRVLFASGKDGVGKTKGMGTPHCQRKTDGGPEEGLANRWSSKRITKKTHVGRGQETKWAIPTISN
jgi:hypothetical protein